jgi:toxin ParE1/3/4
MAGYRLAASAERQIEEILFVSQDKFGSATRERYAALLVTAMQDVADNPRRRRVTWKRTSSGDIGVYHIRESRKSAPNPPGTVGEPRHYIVFRIGADGIVDILGFIHDSMLFDRALRRLVRESRQND